MKTEFFPALYQKWLVDWGQLLLSNNDGQVDEHRLYEHAESLQRWYAPEELKNGPFMTREVCKTEGCRGTVPVSLFSELKPG